MIIDYSVQTLLRRMMNTTNRTTNKEQESSLYTLQACRGVAVLLVSLFHGTILVGSWYGFTPFANFFGFGFAGVHLFFVISGFIILHAHYADADNYRNLLFYVTRRVVRIYPLYWIIFFVWGGWRIFSGRLDFLDFMSNAFLFMSNKKLIIQVSWTLLYEIVFYCIFSCFVIRKSLGIFVFFVWFVLILANYRCGFSGLFVFHHLNLLFIFGFITSFGLIKLKRNMPMTFSEPLALIFMLAGLALFAMTAKYWFEWSASTGSGDYLGFGSITVAFGVASALLLIASLSTKVETFIKKRNLLLLVGNASYSIYLVHFQMERIAINATRSINGVWDNKSQLMANLLLIFIVSSSVVSGVIIHKAIEKPILTRFRKLLILANIKRVEPE